MAQEPSGLTKYDETADSSPVKLGDAESDDNTDPVVSDETERLHSEIEETRENMGETIDAIQERLSLANLSEQVSEKVSDVIESAKESIYDATIGKVVNFMQQARDGVTRTSVGKTITANPIPFALIGAGTAMLIYNGFGKKNTKRLSKYRSTEYLATGQGERRSAGLIGGAADTISTKAGGAYEAISEKAGSALGTVSNAASRTFSGATDAAGHAVERIEHLGSAAKENYDHYVEEKPLAVAAAAMAVGAVVGLALPSTNYEGKLMGETRENLLSKAEDTATEFVDKAKQVASDVTDTVSKEIGTRTPGTTQTF
jgi:ElaB/YqjD/DUF883 family membrane-anchored ribosome-binding protein